MRWGTKSIAAALLAASLLAACGGDDDDDGDAGGDTAVLTEGCGSVPPPPERKVPPPKGDFELTRPTSATVETSEGTFSISLDSERAPRTAGSFAYLAKQGFYDGLQFHRIEPGFVIQGGDPLSGTPEVGSGGPGYCIDEDPPGDLVYGPGVVAMAKTQVEPPGYSGSQFFVVTAPADAGLPPEYALVGKVGKGFDVVKRIEALGGPDGRPTRPVTIERITIEAPA